MALVVIDDVKTFLQIELEDKIHDELLNLLIDHYSGFIEGYCRRIFALTEYTETYDGDNTSILLPDEYPINSVSALSIDSIACESEDYKIYTDEGKIKLVDGSIFTKGNQNIEVTYKAGYELIPEDIKHVCIEMIITKFKIIDSGRIGIISETVGDQSINFVQTEFTDKIKGVLNRYRKSLA